MSISAIARDASRRAFASASAAAPPLLELKQEAASLRASCTHFSHARLSIYRRSPAKRYAVYDDTRDGFDFER